MPGAAFHRREFNTSIFCIQMDMYFQEKEVAKAEEEEERGENKESIPHNYKNNGSKEAQNSRNTGLPCLEKYVLTHSGGGGGRWPSKCI